MAKSDHPTFNPAAYAPVADRIRLFREAFPNGCITTRLVSRTDRDVVFEARVYRSPEEIRPAATGWAAEREGDGDVNAVACLENTETSAVGRALANLGFTAARERPSAEEMQKAARARSARLRGPRPRSRADEGLQPTTDAATDVLDLLLSAQRLGLSKARAQIVRRAALQGRPELATLDRCTRMLQAWIRRQVTAELHAPETWPQRPGVSSAGR